MNTRELFGPVPPSEGDGDYGCGWFSHDWRLTLAEAKTKAYGCQGCDVLALVELVTLSRPASLAEVAAQSLAGAK